MVRLMIILCAVFFYLNNSFNFYNIFVFCFFIIFISYFKLTFLIFFYFTFSVHTNTRGHSGNCGVE